MIFTGIDPGSRTYEAISVTETGNISRKIEIPTDLVKQASYSLLRYLLDERPVAVAMPSGHGLPFKKITDLSEKEIFLLTLADPEKEGHLRNFIRSSKAYIFNGFTIPGVIELDSVPVYRKINVIDMGTADKVASAFFYRTMYDNFVLVEIGSNFSSILVVQNGEITDGFGGTILPGFSSAGFLDGEIAYLLCKYAKISKETIYSGGNWERGVEIIRIISEWYSSKYDLPIIVSGRRKWDVDFGKKFSFPFKESAIGSAYIANSLYGGIYRKYIDFLKSAGTPLSHVRLKGWEEIISLTRI
ncbi:DUF1464 family protein [Sulfolobus acidocaldarius]|uniref:Conserved Archaeal protein n=4 Tax=Sulfolobus acidocaldarius TaxID=2285 RepID=Q4JBF6_SULAC|nr:DUF1464 family protein [Sulfolobus acidocaldarius]AAY79873.1 conserved Archaeal protein [Sulfolobus acidocaldarius DSM 639]AGE70435.1 hypothetical protein SacN8_02270 [Sulfolobus acidocaldarius N8]AGE72709.1 hypothetical protein SacRon12I_02265 [Sulfolobus acidocaldarius Ron12/I]ALU29180.1 acetate kinase [Sulfolobus acidocaldarius]ALU31907.1 acetate kinase [Sulfolobus acidocaldarius]